jgi:hypothetical protein
MSGLDLNRHIHHDRRKLLNQSLSEDFSVLDKAEDFLNESEKLQKYVRKKVSRKEQQKRAGIQKQELINCKKQCGGLTEVSESEIQPRKSAGECLKCVWPANSKGAYQIMDCWRQLK